MDARRRKASLGGVIWALDVWFGAISVLMAAGGFLLFRELVFWYLAVAGLIALLYLFVIRRGVVRMIPDRCRVPFSLQNLREGFAWMFVQSGRLAPCPDEEDEGLEPGKNTIIYDTSSGTMELGTRTAGDKDD